MRTFPMCLPWAMYLKASSTQSLPNTVVFSGWTTPSSMPSFSSWDTSSHSWFPSSKRASNRIPWNATFFRKRAIPGETPTSWSNMEKNNNTIICVQFEASYWPRGEFLDKSYLPISRNLPCLARHRTLACNFSSAREFSTTFTPDDKTKCQLHKLFRIHLFEKWLSESRHFI